MTALAIEPEVIRWTIGGVPATADAAIAALTDHPLLVLMHGLGSNEGDLIGLAPGLPLGFVCASLRAPFAMPQQMMNGFTWFPESLQASDSAPGAITENAAWQAAGAVLDWLDTVDAAVTAAGSRPAECVVMGFSQGGVMATSLLRSRPERFSAAVNCSGFTAPGEFPGDEVLAETRPPLFWGRDALDPVITGEAVARTGAWQLLHSTLDSHEYVGMGHSISRDELDDLFAFLSREIPSAGQIR